MTQHQHIGPSSYLEKRYTGLHGRRILAVSMRAQMVSDNDRRKS